MARITYNECSICKGDHKSLRMTIRLKNTQGVYVDVSIGDYILAHNNCKPTVILDNERKLKTKLKTKYINVRSICDTSKDQ